MDSAQIFRILVARNTRMWPSGARPALATLQQLIVCRDWSRSVVHPFSEMLIQSSKFKNVVPIKVFL